MDNVKTLIVKIDDSEKSLINNYGLRLQPVIVNVEYGKKWNTKTSAFYQLYLNNKKLSDTLYRKGGLFNDSNFFDKQFILLLKHCEEYYSDIITKNKESKPHLASYHTIINTKTGKEEYVYTKYASIYLVKNSCIAFHGTSYFNIKTGEVYSTSVYEKLESKEFIFLDCQYNKDGKFNGVMQINKETGEVINKYE